MNNRYQLDPFTISILFNLASEEESEKLFSQFQGIADKVVDKAITDYLLGKGFSEEELFKFFGSENSQDFPEIQRHLEMPEFADFISARVIEFNKKIYDDRMPLLTEEKRRELEAYLQELGEVNDAAIEEALKILTVDKKADESSTATTVDNSEMSQLSNP